MPLLQLSKRKGAPTLTDIMLGEASDHMPREMKDLMEKTFREMDDHGVALMSAVVDATQAQAFTTQLQDTRDKKRESDRAYPVHVRHYHCDHLGTPIGMTQASEERQGELVWAARYDACGRIEKECNPQAVDQPIRFQGQQFDQETGLNYNRFRLYDLAAGRYLTQDPIGLMGGSHLYEYAFSDSLRYTDPLGLMGGGDHSPCSCPVPPPMPGSSLSCPKKLDVDKNIEKAKLMGPYEFYKAVRNKGVWDYKQQSSAYQDFGNFNFGATGYAAGLGPLLLPGAGWAQSQAGTSKLIWGDWYGKAPYGDDPDDQKMIRAGMEYARCGCAQ